MLEDHLISYMRIEDKNKAYIYSDNAPCHRANLIQEYLRPVKLPLIDWLGYLLDLNR